VTLKKFGPNDVLKNTMKAHPSCEFFVFDGKIYYNNTPTISGAFASNILNVPDGHISLYEYNIDRAVDLNPFIYPFITKDSAGASFKTAGQTIYTNEFVYGDTITGSYPLSASIVRQYMTTPGARKTGVNKQTEETYEAAPLYPHFYALKNRLNYYGRRSQQYLVSSSFGNKNTQTINLISIPSIFYGAQIKPGSISLKWYFTGSLAAELQDNKRNGELIEVSGSNIGNIGGVVLYDEGFLLLTGSWALNSESIIMAAGASADSPKWIYFGAGANDAVNTTTAGASYSSASFNLSFKGTTQTQVITMMAHAARGEANYSNNPTFLKYGQQQLKLTSSQVYEENTERQLKNIVSSSFKDFDAPFKRQVYISRIAIYDDNKNLIGIATLANPILKKEDEDISFKLKLDV